MFNIAKTLTLGAAAILSASTASAQDTINATFSYDRAASLEQNYAAFEMTAKRACEGMSSLLPSRANRTCRADLIAQAVSATKLSSFIAYHQNRASNVQIASARR